MHRRRCTNVKSTLIQRLVSAGKYNEYSISPSEIPPPRDIHDITPTMVRFLPTSVILHVIYK